jgi:hypothetical protein
MVTFICVPPELFNQPRILLELVIQGGSLIQYTYFLYFENYNTELERKFYCILMIVTTGSRSRKYVGANEDNVAKIIELIPTTSII